MKWKELNSVSLALHDTSDHLFGWHLTFRARENRADRSMVPGRKPRHTGRMEVKFTQPTDARQDASQGGVDRTRVFIIDAVMVR